MEQSIKKRHEWVYRAENQSFFRVFDPKTVHQHGEDTCFKKPEIPLRRRSQSCLTQVLTGYLLNTILFAEIMALRLGAIFDKWARLTSVGEFLSIE